MSEQRIQRSLFSRLMHFARHAAAVICLILFAMALVLWFGKGIYRFPKNPRQLSTWRLGYDRQENGNYTDQTGEISISYFQPWPLISPQTFAQFQQRVISENMSEINWIGSKLWWHWYYRSLGTTNTNLECGASLQIPFWQLAILFLIPPIFLWLIPALDARLIRRAKYIRGEPNPVCRRCGYDLRATPNQCPECGQIPPPALSVAPFIPGFRSQLRRISIAILLLLFLLVCQFVSIYPPLIGSGQNAFSQNWNNWLSVGYQYRIFVWPVLFLPVALLFAKARPAQDRRLWSGARLPPLVLIHLAVVGLWTIVYRHFSTSAGYSTNACIEILGRIEPFFIPAELWILLGAFQSLSMQMTGQPLQRQLHFSRVALCTALLASFTQKMAIAVIWIFEGFGQQLILDTNSLPKPLATVCGLFCIYFMVLLIRFRRIVRWSLKMNPVSDIQAKVN